MNVSWLRNYVSVAIELLFVDIFTATILIGRGCSTGGGRNHDLGPRKTGPRGFNLW